MKFLVEQIMSPIVRRVGSLAAGTAVTYGVTVPQAEAIELAIIAVAGIGFDLFNSYNNRNK